MSENSTRLYPIEVDSKWGFIDASGNIIIEPLYGDVRRVHDGVIWVNIGGTPQPMIMDTGGKWGLIDTRGNVLFEPSIALWELNDFSEGVAWVLAAPGKTKELWGLVNKAGSFIIPPSLEFDVSPEPSLFQGGVSMIHVNGKIGIVDTTGRFILQPTRFNDASWFQGDRAWVHEGGDADAGYWGDGIVGGKWGLINRQGTVVVEPRFDDHHEFSDGVAWVNQEGHREEPNLLEPSPECKGGRWGLIDQDGNLLLDVVFARVTAFIHGRARVEHDGVWECIDKEGNLSSMEYDDFSDEDLDETDEIRNRDNEADETDEEDEDDEDNEENEKEMMMDDVKFSFMHSYIKGSAWVNVGGTTDFSGLRGGKWGLINKAGKYLVKPIYDSVFEMPGGELTEVKLGTKWGYVNRRGEKIWFHA